MNIYKIENMINGKVYVGSETVDNTRWKTHLYRLKKGNHHSIKLQRAWNKYGEINFSFSIIESGIITNNLLLEREQCYIDTLYSDYNICRIAGNTKGVKQTPESNKKRSLTLKGRKCSHEEIKLREKRMNGLWSNPEWSKTQRENIGLANKNKIISSESRDKMSKSMSKYRIFEYNADTLVLIRIFENIKECSYAYNLDTRKLKDYLNTKFGVVNNKVLRYEHIIPIKKIKQLNQLGGSINIAVS
jgi:group I intron endonuclease